LRISEYVVFVDAALGGTLAAIEKTEMLKVPQVHNYPDAGAASGQMPKTAHMPINDHLPQFQATA